MSGLYEARPPALAVALRSPPNSAGRRSASPPKGIKAGAGRVSLQLILSSDLHVHSSLPPYSSSRSYSFCASRWLTCSSGAWRSGLCSTPLVLRDFLYPTRPGTLSLTAHASPSRVWHALYSLSTPGLRRRGRSLRTTSVAGLTFEIRLVSFQSHALRTGWADVAYPVNRSSHRRPVRVIVVLHWPALGEWPSLSCSERKSH